ncbi:MAG: glycosyltransferase family 2 protein [Bacillota bacterium]
MEKVAAVVPCMNEVASIQAVIRSCLSGGCDVVVVVANGCTDGSGHLARQVSGRVQVIEFPEPLGLDVPRAAGAAIALREGARAIVFVDGDMEGVAPEHIATLVDNVRSGAGIALTDCFKGGLPGFGMAGEVTWARLELNRTLGLESRIGAAIPSHGPSCVSSEFLELSGLRPLCVPPVCLAVAARHGVAVVVGARVSHESLGSPYRRGEHGRKLAETIIGDCIEAECVYLGRPPGRVRDGRLFDGYHSSRRFDLLAAAGLLP